MATTPPDSPFKKRSREEKEEQVEVPQAKRTKLEDRLAALEEKVKQLETTVATYERQYPLKTCPDYDTLRWQYIRKHHKNCRDLRFHHGEEFPKFDSWAMNLSLEVVARHVGHNL